MAKATKQALTMEEQLAQALVPESEQPYAVPENWIWARLLSVFMNMTSSQKKLQQKDYLDEGLYAVVDQGKELVGGYTDDETLLYDGDLPVIVFGDHTRIVKYIDFKFAQGADGVKLLYPREFIKDKLFFYVLQNLEIPDLGYRRHFPLFPQFCIPIPPLAEQRRIVERIEGLFEKLDHAKELVQKSLDSFETRKAAVLHKAFTGELTAHWREINKCDIVDTDALLETERENVQRSHNTKKGFKYTPSVKIDLGGRTKGIDELYCIPDTWHWVSIGQITWSVSDGPHFSPNYVDQGYPMVSARNIKYREIDFSDAKYVSEEDYREFIKRGKPEVGDILLTKGGTTGIATDVTEDKDFCVWVHVAILKLLDKYVSSKYIRDVLASTTLYRQAQELTHGVGNQDLGLTRLIYMALPLPPLPEQQEIVRILDGLLEKEQRAHELYDIIEKIDLMKKAILARAFRGELGTNDPSEESALGLLRNVIATGI